MHRTQSVKIKSLEIKELYDITMTTKHACHMVNCDNRNAGVKVNSQSAIILLILPIFHAVHALSGHPYIILIIDN